MRFRCISLGPRHNGRDYGLLQRFRSTQLPGAVAGRLGDFAMALLEWGLQPRPEFAACFPLDERRSHTFLVKVAYLGREALGPVVIGNGLLIDAAANQAMEGKPHRLLDSIRPPSLGEWTQNEVELQLSAAAAGHREALGEVARSLEISDDAATIEVADGTPPSEVVAEILEKAWISGAPLSWSTTNDLIRIENFKPSDFRLVVHAVDPQSPRAPGSARLRAGGIEGDLPKPSRLLRLCRSLGIERPRLDGGELETHGSARSGQPDSELRAILAERMKESLRSAVDDRSLFGILDRWLEGSSALPPEDRRLAQMAIAGAFRGRVEEMSDGDRQAELISIYCRDVWARLEDGPRELPAALAARLRLLPLFSEAQLEWLLEHGLAGSFSRDTRTTIREGRFSRGQTAAIARVLHRLLEETSGGDGGFAADVVESAVARAEGETKALTPEEDGVLALCDSALLAEPETPRWRHLATLMARALKLRLLRKDGPDPRFEAVRLALTQAFLPPDPATVRRAWVAVNMLELAGGSAE